MIRAAAAALYLDGGKTFYHDNAIAKYSHFSRTA